MENSLKKRARSEVRNGLLPFRIGSTGRFLGRAEFSGSRLPSVVVYLPFHYVRLVPQHVRTHSPLRRRLPTLQHDRSFRSRREEGEELLDGDEGTPCGLEEGREGGREVTTGRGEKVLEKAYWEGSLGAGKVRRGGRNADLVLSSLPVPPWLSKLRSRSRSSPSSTTPSSPPPPRRSEERTAAGTRMSDLDSRCVRGEAEGEGAGADGLRRYADPQGGHQRYLH